MFTFRNLMPKFDIPDGYTEVTWFREETMRGMHRRFPGGIPEDRMKQVEYEMDTIISMGFPGYFLVVADFIMWAKNQASRSAPAEAPRPARSSPTPWASPTSTPSRTA